MTRTDITGRAAPPPPQTAGTVSTSRVALSAGIPVLDTERLTLTGPTEKDFEPYAAYWASDRACYMGGPRDERWAWGKFAAHVGHWSLRGFGFWSVRHAGRPIGFCGIHRPSPLPEPLLGWILYDGHEGRGYATEAATAALRWWFVRGETALTASIERGNAASRAVARRLGGIDTGQTPVGEADTISAWTFASAELPS